MNNIADNEVLKETLENWEETYISIKATAIAKEMENTLIALSLAIQFHDGQYRKGGDPYIIHPLMVCKYLINLNVYDDITCAAALLHDVIEDCGFTYEEAHRLFVDEYNLDEKIYDLVLILTKPKDYKKTDPDQSKYYSKIKKNKIACIIKLSDRANNLSTIDAFTKNKMINYVNETKTLIYDLCKYCKSYYPEYSNAVTIMKYQIQSICETIEALFDIKPLGSEPLNYRKTFIFIRDYSIGKELQNTQKSVFIANKLHKGDLRKSGDPFIIHPLRVCSYLIALKINNDITCSAALLHEVLKRCNLPKGGEELITDYKLDPEILNIIRLLTKSEGMTNDEYYKNLSTNKYAILIKLSNRAHTCTRLSTYSNEEKEAYILETKKYISKLCTDAQEEHPEYWRQIEIMKYHIFSICKIVKAIMDIENKNHNA